ncbi:MAG: iron-containing alcohol dehydrogenase family protein [Bacillota bacterium]|nr:iron-containing alcohol dehydrogenase family protein [Bacillota bacterium]
MESVFSPPRYYRGINVISEMGKVCSLFGKRAVLIGGHKAFGAAKEKVVVALTESGIEVVDALWYGGECTWNNIDSVAAKVKELNVDFVVGIGGGKAIDTSKAVAFRTGVAIVTVPTIAATCAPVTPLSIIHTAEGFYLENTLDSALPVAIFADTDVIANGPSQLLFAGMGDTLAKWYEIRATTSRIPKTSWTIGAVSLAKACYDVIVEFGGDAKIAVENNESTFPLEQIVDSIIWHAGMCSILGGDKCRGAAAHAVYFGFTNIDEAHKRYHGELVGYGNLCLLELEGRPEEEIISAIKLAKSIGVPITLDEIGKMTEADIELVAKVATASNEMKYMPVTVDEAMTVKAIYAIDQKGKTLTNN